MKTPQKKNGPKKRAPKPGGKALERLRQFERERGLEPSDPTHGKPAPKPPKEPTKR